MTAPATSTSTEALTDATLAVDNRKWKTWPDWVNLILSVYLVLAPEGEPTKRRRLPLSFSTGATG